MQVKLKVASGSHAGKEIAVSGSKFLIGRSDECQLRPKSESVSRRHCVLVVRDNRLLIQDLKSRNGTYVNDVRLPTDRAKALKDGDQLRVGKLEFTVILDHGLGGAKKPQVRDVKDAASRTVGSGSSDSRFEDVDISDWLEEADQIDRVRRQVDPETRQLRLDTPVEIDSKSGSSSGDSTELVPDEDSADKRPRRPEKKPPGKLPKTSSTAGTSDSRDAAGQALKRFFSGR